MTAWQSGSDLLLCKVTRVATDSETVATISGTMIFSSTPSYHNNNYNGKTLMATDGV